MWRLGPERLALAEIGKVGWTDNDLKRHRKGDPRKIAIAREIRAKTTVPLGLDCTAPVDGNPRAPGLVAPAETG